MPSQKLDCFAADVTKATSTYGFNWKNLTWLNSLDECRRDVKCDAGKGTCNCYVTAKPWEVVWFDKESQTAVGYQCTTFRYAIDTTNKNLGNPKLLTDIVGLYNATINSLHYSGLVVFTKNLATL